MLALDLNLQPYPIPPSVTCQLALFALRHWTLLRASGSPFDCRHTFQVCLRQWQVSYGRLDPLTKAELYGLFTDNE